MSVGLLLYLAIVASALFIGLTAKSPGRAIVFAALLSVGISIFVVIWYQSFFPFEASGPDMQAYEHYSPGQLILVWLYFRAGARAGVAVLISLCGYLIKTAIQRGRPKTAR